MFIIPARLGSSRFKEKVLVEIEGVPMVVRTAQQAQKIAPCVVACDDEKIMNICEQFHIKAVLTSVNHPSGTDRINEACDILGLSDDTLVINLQGDEPFIEPEVLSEFLSFTTSLNDDFVMSSCYRRIDALTAQDPNFVKVVVNNHNEALYFSRACIPYDREGGFNEYKGHLGLYGFRRSSLREFCSWEESFLEQIEKLEQLRALSHGKKIAMKEVSTRSFGIDTPADLEKAIRELCHA